MVLYAPLALDEETRDTHWEAPIHQKVLSRQTLKTEEVTLSQLDGQKLYSHQQSQSSIRKTHNY